MFLSLVFRRVFFLLSLRHKNVGSQDRAVSRETLASRNDRFERDESKRERVCTLQLCDTGFGCFTEFDEVVRAGRGRELRVGRAAALGAVGPHLLGLRVRRARVRRVPPRALASATHPLFKVSRQELLAQSSSFLAAEFFLRRSCDSASAKDPMRYLLVWKNNSNTNAGFLCVLQHDRVLVRVNRVQSADVADVLLRDERDLRSQQRLHHARRQTGKARESTSGLCLHERDAQESTPNRDGRAHRC